MMIAAHERRYPDAVRRLAAEMGNIIAQLERPQIVFRPANSVGAWWIGPKDDARIFVSVPASRVLLAAYQAIGGQHVSASSLVRTGSKHVENAARNQLKRAAEWVEEHAGCALLAQALRGVGVRAGVIVYEEPDFTLEILR